MVDALKGTCLVLSVEIHPLNQVLDILDAFIFLNGDAISRISVTLNIRAIEDMHILPAPIYLDMSEGKLLVIYLLAVVVIVIMSVDHVWPRAGISKLVYLGYLPLAQSFIAFNSCCNVFRHGHVFIVDKKGDLVVEVLAVDQCDFVFSHNNDLTVMSRAE